MAEGAAKATVNNLALKANVSSHTNVDRDTISRVFPEEQFTTSPHLKDSFTLPFYPSLKRVTTASCSITLISILFSSASAEGHVRGITCMEWSFLSIQNVSLLNLHHFPHSTS